MTDRADNDPNRMLLKKEATQDFLRGKIFKAVRVLEERLDDPPTAGELAKTVGISIFHFHRIFRSVVGESVIQHIRRLRFERGAFYLKYSAWQVADIAVACGFQNQASFARGFKCIYGETPMQFRKSEGTIPFLRGYMRSRPGYDQTFTCVSKLTVCIKDWPEQAAIGLRFYGSANEVHKPWGELLKWAREAIPNLDQARFFGLWFDDWSGDGDHYRYECVIVPAQPLAEESPQPFFTRTLPAGEVAVAAAKGSLKNLDASWSSFFRGWLPFSGWQPRGEYVMDEYPADLMLASTIRQFCIGIGGSISIKMCVPVQKGAIAI